MLRVILGLNPVLLRTSNLVLLRTSNLVLLRTSRALPGQRRGRRRIQRSFWTGGGGNVRHGH
jgi:hypothetical protein